MKEAFVVSAMTNRVVFVAILVCQVIAWQASANSSLVAEQTLIVDCLLPGKVRKLGINRTYVSRKRPTKTSANDCEIKGGDYVKYDRATLASSLSVWQQEASQGSAEAQYYVGEIFEKGMGQTPDYEMAVSWYRRAVDQGYTPAMMSLGRLHELGLGLPKDLVKAMNLYRRASGLTDDEIAYASVFDQLKQQDEKRIAELEEQLDRQTRKTKSLMRKTQVLRSDAQRAEKNVEGLKQEIEQLKQKLASASAQAKAELEAEMLARRSDLKIEQSFQSDLQSRLVQVQDQLKSAEKKLALLRPTGAAEVVLKWPDFSVENGINSSTVPSGSIVNLVGAVTQFSRVKSLKINGEEYELDTNGLFLKSIDVGRDPQDIDIALTDDTGKKTITKVRFEPSSDLNVVLAGAGSLTRTKFDFGRYHALVIGNNAYDLDKGWEPLDTAVNDAQAIAELLEKKYGFEVRLELDANRDTILTALEEMRKKLTSNDNLLVYYAGHGLVDPENDQGYWVPVDGAVDSAVRWVSNASITDQIRAMTARNVMVIADSCYSGSLMRSGIVTLRSGLSAEKKALRLGEDLKQLTRVALSSGGLQPVIDSVDNSQHSVFANAILRVLRGNSELLDADSLATQVAHSVALATKDNVKQVPRYAPLAAGGHQGGEFYFSPLAKENSNRR